MRKIGCLILVLSLICCACRKDPQAPINPRLPVGRLYTIEDILNLEPGFVFSEPASVYGIVTADEKSGNFYQEAYLQDRLTGLALRLEFNTTSGVSVGDSIRVCLEGAMFVNNHNQPQLSDLGDAKNCLEIIAQNNPIEPINATMGGLLSGDFPAGCLVRLENVMFTEQTTFADLGNATYGDRILIDVENSNNTINVRTSNFANFAGDMLPTGICNIVAIATVYNKTWQLRLRSKDDLEEEGDAPTPPIGGEVQSLPYFQSFETDFGTYITKDVTGDQRWEIAFSTAKMTGYNSTNNANEDWLISSPVDLTGVNDAKMTMSYIGRYFNNINEDVTIWASMDYIYGDEPYSATWTQVPATLTEGSNWSTFLTAEIALTDYVGQTVTFAVKYLSTDQKAGTLEIQSIAIEEGSVVTPTPTPTPIPTPTPTVGSGTQDDPYNVASGISLQSEEPIAWVQGYIVGAVKSGNTSVSSNDQINWVAPFDIATNVVIADDPACNEISQCIFVNLPAGKPLRTQVNLMDNPGNLGKTLAVNGKLRTYFGQAGLRDSGGTENDFVLEGGTPTPTPTPTPGDAIFSETFAEGQGDFAIQDVVLPSELNYVWAYNSIYHFMKASGFAVQSYEVESWLVSPSIVLSDVSSATLTFDQAVNYGSPEGLLQVLISSDYSGDVTTARWTELSLNAWPAGSDWTFITSTADLTPYVGQTVNIAFKYTSTVSVPLTWEVKNVVVE